MADHTDPRVEADGALKPAVPHAELSASELRGTCPLPSEELVRMTTEADGDEL